MSWLVYSIHLSPEDVRSNVSEVRGGASRQRTGVAFFHVLSINYHEKVAQI